MLPKLDVWETQTSEPQPSRVAKLPRLSEMTSRLPFHLSPAWGRLLQVHRAAFNILIWIHSLLEAFIIFYIVLRYLSLRKCFCRSMAHRKKFQLGLWQSALRGARQIAAVVKHQVWYKKPVLFWDWDKTTHPLQVTATALASSGWWKTEVKGELLDSGQLHRYPKRGWGQSFLTGSSPSCSSRVTDLAAKHRTVIHRVFVAANSFLS